MTGCITLVPSVIEIVPNHLVRQNTPHDVKTHRIFHFFDCRPPVVGVIYTDRGTHCASIHLIYSCGHARHVAVLLEAHAHYRPHYSVLP